MIKWIVYLFCAIRKPAKTRVYMLMDDTSYLPFAAIFCVLLTPCSAFSQIIPVKAEVNLNGQSKSSENFDDPSLSVSGTFASSPVNPVVTSSFGSYLNVSGFESGVYSYTESDASNMLAGGSLAGISNSGGYSYHFHTTSNYKMAIDYSFSGDSYFIGNNVSVSDGDGGLLGNFSFDNSPHLASLLLEGNRDYVLSASLNNSLSGPGVWTGTSGSTKADFTYSVFFTLSSATPEPTAWVMMIIGLGMTGGLMRHQRDRRSMSERHRFAGG